MTAVNFVQPRTDNKIALLTNQGINDGNILEYLGVIEQKAVEIITSYIRSGSGNRAATAVIGPALPKQVSARMTVW